jgi:glycosyltransferase involved in cell wall biosynthesis
VLTADVAQLCKPDSTSMADGLCSLLEDPEKCRELGERGRELVEQNYSRAAYRRKLEDFYNSISVRI